jgi:L-serine dehydratase
MNIPPFHRILFYKEFLPFHSNGMKFTATLANGKEHVATFYPLVVDFVKEERVNAKKKIEIKHAFPFPTDKRSTF